MKSEIRGAAVEIKWKKRLLIALWIKWESFIYRFFQIHPIDEQHPFLNARIRTYWGKAIQLPDGEEIQRGDQVLELHLNNDMLFKLGINSNSSFQLAIQMIRMTEQLLPKALPFILNHPQYEKIMGFYGITIIHRGTAKLGFTVIDLPRGFFFIITKIYLRLLLRVVHPKGRQRLHLKRELLVPKIIAISTKEFIRRYAVNNI